MSIQLYIDWLSQPSRFVAIVFDLLKVDFKIQETRIQDNKQKTQEFAKINPVRKVPAIQDNGFNLAESHTIVKYVIRSRNIQTDLYPLNDLKKTAKIDEYLDYHHTNTRKCSVLFFNIFIAPRTGIETTVNLEQARKDVELVLKFIDQYILSKSTFIVGNSLTIADLSAYCEIYQLHMIKFDFSKYENISAWMKRVAVINEVSKAHEVIQKIVKKINPNAKL